MSLLRHLISVIALLSLTACMSFTPSNEGGSFVLTEDFLWTVSGIGGNSPRLVGLTPGEYIAVGHNSDGIYYRGPYGGILVLEPETAQHYLKTGERPIDVSHLIISNGLNGEGGVFIPYSPEDRAFLYFYQDFRRLTGDRDAGMPARPPSEINTFKGDPPAGDELPFRPMAVKVIDPLNPGAPPTPAAALGAGIAPYVGRAIGLPALRGMQGNPIFAAPVDDQKLLKILHTVMLEKRYVKSSASPGQ
ncbi:MAG: hypothetical protein LBJ33_15270 [Pseudomonas putida]|nr:hypothetical protein [Pseudomonas putida]